MAIFLFAGLLMQNAAAAPNIVNASIPSEAEAGEPIHIWANVTSSITEYSVYISYVNPANGTNTYIKMSGNETLGTWTYQIPAQPWKGTLEVMITAVDGSGSAQYPVSGFKTIQIIGNGQPQPFPWNIVVIVIFLGVVLVLTEFIYKPGFYRPTGRERAKLLEEEDRKREEEDRAKENTK